MRAPHPVAVRELLDIVDFSATPVRLLVVRALRTGPAMDCLLDGFAEAGLCPVEVDLAAVDGMPAVEMRLAGSAHPVQLTAAQLALSRYATHEHPQPLSRPRVAVAGQHTTWTLGLRHTVVIDGDWLGDGGRLRRGAPDLVMVRGHTDERTRQAVTEVSATGIPVVLLGGIADDWDGPVDLHETGLDPLPPVLSPGHVATGPDSGPAGFGEGGHPQRGGTRGADWARAEALRLRAHAAASQPVAVDHVAPDVRVLLGDDLSDALTTSLAGSVDAGVHEARRTVHIQRLLQRDHGLSSRLRSLLTALDIPFAQPPVPRVSIIVDADRPADTQRLLEQARAQDHPDVEVVLVGTATSWTDGPPPDLTVATSASRGLGRAAAGAAATGQLITVFENGWYAPEFVSDLLHARDRSAATIVGKAPEFKYRASDDVTLYRRCALGYDSPPDPAAIMVSADDLAAVGNWPDADDASGRFIERVTAFGGAVYTGHAFGRVGLEAAGGPAPPTTQKWVGLRLDVAAAGGANDEVFGPPFAPGRPPGS